MKLSEFDYHLPAERIALRPAEPRDSARLLCLRRKTGEISHHAFNEIGALLKSSDLLVLNNTKVFPARLFGQRLGLASEAYSKESHPRAMIEVLLLKPLGEDIWQVLVKPGRKMRVGERVRFGNGRMEGIVIERGDLGQRKMRFKYSGNFELIVDELGHVPLPPYIDRPDESDDRFSYQTVYARRRGAVAAPTAGLHFTRSSLSRLKNQGIEICEITLHVGLGTFQPVHVEDIENHQIESERFEISEEAAKALNTAKEQGRRIVAVGTTVTRTLESLTKEKGRIQAGSGETNLFIFPGFSFNCVDVLLTNFHLPRSTLLMLVCAFAGKDLAEQAYQDAIRMKYRFYSYGDCMLIL